MSGSAESKETARLETQAKSKGSLTPTDSVAGLEDIHNDADKNGNAMKHASEGERAVFSSYRPASGKKVWWHWFRLCVSVGM